MFGTFGWKTTIHAPDIGVLRLFDHYGMQYQPKPKRHTLAACPHHLNHQRENPISGATCM